MARLDQTADAIVCMAAAMIEAAKEKFPTRLIHEYIETGLRISAPARAEAQVPA